MKAKTVRPIPGEKELSAKYYELGVPVFGVNSYQVAQGALP